MSGLGELRRFIFVVASVAIAVSIFTLPQLPFIKV